MITTSEIIQKLIKDKGYRSMLQFCKKNGLVPEIFFFNMGTNSWTKEYLERISNALKVDLSKFATNQRNGKRKYE